MDENENQNIIIGEHVQKIIERFNLTQKEFAIRIGYGGDNPDRAINMIVHGRRPLPAKKRDRINDEFGLNPDYLLLRSEYMTRKEAVQALIGQMQNLDVMWTEFIKHIALRSGYEMKECENGHPAKDETMVIDTETPYLSFENGSDSYDFTIKDTNIFIDDISRYAELRLKMMLERKKGE